MYKNESSFRFEKKTGEWAPFKLNEESTIKLPSNIIKAGSYNVLKSVKSKFTEYFLQSDKRFLYQMKEIFPQMNFDIIGLNEVTQYYLDNCLLKSEFIRQKYFLSEIQVTKTKSMFNVILSKFPMTVYRIPDREEVICSFEFEENLSFIVIIAHLKAYEGNVEKRANELSSLIKCVYSYENSDLQKALKDGNILIMGDFNFHLPYETKLIYELGFVDIWLEHGLKDEEYTWDSLKNSLINSFLIFDNRRMRLDRMIFSENNKIFDILPESERNVETPGMIIFADKPISSFKKLFPSDHFGLCCNLKIKSSSSSYEIKNPSVKEQSLLLSKLKYRSPFRSIKRIIFYRLLLMGAILLFILYLLYRLIGVFFLKYK